MAYGIMRIGKIKAKDQMRRAYEHNYRIARVENADPQKTDQNQELIGLPYKNGKQMTYLEQWIQRLNSLPYYASTGENKKPRKNAVLALEVMTTFSREHRDKIDMNKWKDENLKWLDVTFNADKIKYGNNILSVVYHDDETGNAHCHAFIQPIDEHGKLNAFHFTGGRENGISKFRQLNDSYAEQMKQFDLERGRVGSTAEHMSIKKFYAGLNEAIKNVPAPREGELAIEYYLRYQQALETLSAVYYRESLKKKSHMEQQLTAYANKLQSIILPLKKDLEQLRNEHNTISMTHELEQKKYEYKIQEYNEKLESIQDAIASYESEFTDMQLFDLTEAFSNDSPLFQQLAKIDFERAIIIQTQISEFLAPVIPDEER